MRVSRLAVWLSTIGLLATTACAAAFLLAGNAAVPLWIMVVSMIAFALTRWFPASMSIAIAILTFLAIELALLRFAALLPIGLPVVEAMTWGAVAIACAGLMVVHMPRADLTSTWGEVSVVAASSAGGLILLGVVAAAQKFDTANAIAWAMRGDSVNVITVARGMVADNGIAAGEAHQPTPLPFGMIASNLMGGRTSVSDGALLGHDLDRYAQVWVLLLAACCFLAGLAVARPLSRRSRVLASVAGAATSVIPLSWFWLGIQLQSGFENSTLAAVVLLCSWIVYLEFDKYPTQVVTMIVVASTVMLAVWSPVILALGAVSCAAAVHGRREIASSSRTSLLTLVAAVAVLISYGLLVTLPDYVQNADFLSRPGAFPAFALSTATVLASAVALTATVASVVGQKSAALGAGAFVAALATGVVYFMFQRRSEQNLWGYYPQKYAYTVSLVLVVVLISVVAGLLANPAIRQRVVAATLIGCGVLVIGVLGLTPNDDPRKHSHFPLWSMMRGTMFRTSEALATTVLASSGRADGLDMAWRLPDDYSDNLINFWWLQIDLRDPTDNDDRRFSQHEGPRSAPEVCAVIAGLGERMTVHTADPLAESALRGACDNLEFRVVVVDTIPSLYTGP